MKLRESRTEIVWQGNHKAIIGHFGRHSDQDYRGIQTWDAEIERFNYFLNTIQNSIAAESTVFFVLFRSPDETIASIRMCFHRDTGHYIHRISFAILNQGSTSLAKRCFHRTVMRIDRHLMTCGKFEHCMESA